MFIEVKTKRGELKSLRIHCGHMGFLREFWTTDKVKISEVNPDYISCERTAIRYGWVTKDSEYFTITEEGKRVSKRISDYYDGYRDY